MKKASVLAAGFLALILCTGAGSPADELKNPAQEARARALFKEVRCLVCQNESIDDSEAPLANDLRQIVRGQVLAGKSDAEIKRFLTDRYGEFVLLRPKLSIGNAILWGTPFAIVGLGAVGLLIASRRRKVAETAPLDEEEARRLEALAGDKT
jgi:cytochrome c-type biogenesis protein CcmH